MDIKYNTFLVGFFTFLFASLTLVAQNSSGTKPELSEPVTYDWNEGFVKSQKEKDKIMVVDVYTDWCGWCKRMDKDTYADKKIQDILNKKCIFIKFNPEAQGTYKVDNLTLTGPQLLGMLTNNQRTGYPTIIFINSKTREVDIQPGYQNATDFSASLEKAFLVASKK